MDTMRRWMVAFVAGGMLFGLPGCTSGTPKASPPSPTTSARPPSPSPSRSLPNPCRLVTTAQIAAAFGASVGPAQSGDLLGNPECSFAVTATSVGSDVGLQVLVLASYDRARYDKTRASSSQGVDVAGIGDAAFYDPTTFGLTFVKGDLAVLIGDQLPKGAPPPDAAKIKAATVAVATAAASTL